MIGRGGASEKSPHDNRGHEALAFRAEHLDNRAMVHDAYPHWLVRMTGAVQVEFVLMLMIAARILAAALHYPGERLAGLLRVFC